MTNYSNRSKPNKEGRNYSILLLAFGLLGFLIVWFIFHSVGKIKSLIDSLKDSGNKSVEAASTSTQETIWWIVAIVLGLIILGVIVKKSKSINVSGITSKIISGLGIIFTVAAIVFIVLFGIWYFTQILDANSSNHKSSTSVQSEQVCTQTSESDKKTYPEIQIGKNQFVEAGKIYQYFVPSDNYIFAFGIRDNTESVRVTQWLKSPSSKPWSGILTKTRFDIDNGTESSCSNVYYLVRFDKSFIVNVHH